MRRFLKRKKKIIQSPESKRGPDDSEKRSGARETKGDGLKGKNSLYCHPRKHTTARERGARGEKAEAKSAAVKLVQAPEERGLLTQCGNGCGGGGDTKRPFLHRNNSRINLGKKPEKLGKKKKRKKEKRGQKFRQAWSRRTATTIIERAEKPKEGESTDSRQA